jgi:hypothetical protein
MSSICAEKWAEGKLDGELTVMGRGEEAGEIHRKAF